MAILKNRDDQELFVRVAWYYHKTGLTQEEIARRLGLSRARVIKILEMARREGIISTQVISPYCNCLEIERQLIEEWHLRDAFVVPKIDPVEINKNIGAAGAQYIERNLKDEDGVIGIGWGNTVAHMLKFLSLSINGSVSLVTLSGGISSYFRDTHLESHNPFSRFTNQFHVIPTPLMVSTPEICQAFLREKEVERIMRIAELADIAIVGIGGMSQDATFARLGYINPQDIEILSKEGAVGDIHGQYFNSEGVELDTFLQGKIIAIRLEKLKNMKQVIGVAGGEHKVESIKGALKGGFIHSLVTDERTARGLLDRSRGTNS